MEHSGNVFPRGLGAGEKKKLQAGHLVAPNHESNQGHSISRFTSDEFIRAVHEEYVLSTAVTSDTGNPGNRRSNPTQRFPN